MSISSTTLLEGDLRPRVLLVGDVMLDRYVWGDVERISPEAPIPILRIERAGAPPGRGRQRGLHAGGAGRADDPGRRRGR